MAEPPNLPPPLHQQSPNVDESSLSKEDQRELETDNSQVSHKDENEKDSIWTTVNIIISINLVELKLFHLRRESPFATLQVKHVWAAYKSNSLGETFIASSLESFSVSDDREGTEAELRYMIGKVDEFEHNSDNIMQDKGKLKDKESTSYNQCPHKTYLTMLMMDVKLSASSRTISIRVQRPRLLVVLDFLLAFADFFVPSIKSALSEGSDPLETLLDLKNSLFLSQSIYEQTSDIIIFSPTRPLTADHEAIDEYTYDGKGQKIRLLDRRGKDLCGYPKEPCIFVGHGKRLCFKNVTIQNGEHFDWCIYLGSNSSYSASQEDHVFFEGKPSEAVDESMRKDWNFKGEAPPKEGDANKAVETIVEIQAIGPELVFCASPTRSSQPLVVNERLLRVKMNFSFRFNMKEDDLDLDAQVKGLTIESHSGVIVLEPVDLTVKYANVSGKQNIHLAVMDVITNFSFSIIQLILKLQEDVLSFLRITSKQISVECSQFDKIWPKKGKSGEHQVAFWRPRVPPGFAVLGDCLTPLDEPPSKAVLALNTGLGHMKKPLDFVLVWSSSHSCSPYKRTSQNFPDDISDQMANSKGSGPTNDKHGSSEECSVWFPVAPRGYVALGCVATLGIDPPQPTVTLCISTMLVTRWWMKDCISIHSNLPGKEGMCAFWRADNSFGSFFPLCILPSDKTPSPYELRNVAFKLESTPVRKAEHSQEAPAASQEQNNVQHLPDEATLEIPGRLICRSVTRFRLIWWDKGAAVQKHISLWRPVLPLSCGLLGDLAVVGYEPPSLGLVLQSVGEGVLEKPLDFELKGRIHPKSGMKGVSFWLPIAPPGYVALGCLASRTTNLELKEKDSVRCVRNDLVTEAELSPSSLWDSSGLRNVDEKFSLCSLQTIANEAHTFIVTHGSKPPLRRLKLHLPDMQSPDTAENLEMDAELQKFKCTLFNDFGGLMAPLLNISIDGIMASVHGRSNSLSSTANFSLVATTYNGKCDAWEPLIESLDGFIRYNDEHHKSTSLRESQLRVAATSDVNVNLSNGNINMFLEAMSNWRKLDEKEVVLKDGCEQEEAWRDVKQVLAVGRKKYVKLLCYNKLGERIFLRTVDLNGQLNIIELPFGGCKTVQLPNMSLQNAQMSKGIAQKSFNVVILKLDEVELAEGDKIHIRQYFAAIRVFPESYNSDHQHLLKYQSARTRCVTPQKQSSGKLLVRWNEVFLFQIEPNVVYLAEVRVVDFVKGATVGLCTVELTVGVSRPMKQEVAANIWENLQAEWKLLYQPQKSECKQEEPCGRIRLGSAPFFIADSKEERLDEKLENPKIVQVGLSVNGPWRKVSLNSASGTACLKVGNDTAASEITVQKGITHLTIRSLVLLKNNTLFSLEISLFRNCPIYEDYSNPEDESSAETSAIDGNECDSDGNLRVEVVDEIFENERYHPFFGWGSSWPCHLLPTDPGRWSRRDLTGSSQVFPPGELPLGWAWTSDWYIDRTNSSDEDGWLYAFDFKNFNSAEQRSFSESSLSFVRRRQWIRTRQCTRKTGNTRIHIGILKSGESIPLPIASLRDSTQDYCVQVRPLLNESTSESKFDWSQVVFCRGTSENGTRHLPVKELQVRALVGTEEVLSCLLKVKNSLPEKKVVWLCMETTFMKIAKDPVLASIKDWRLIILPPLELINYLPISAEYTILQSSKSKGLRMKDRGLLTSGDTTQIYHADLQKPLYLSWLSQGGWHPKHEAFLISHPYWEVARYMTLRNSVTGRKVRVRIEQDDEGKQIIAKRIRVFVLYWLDCERCPPLNLRLFELKPQDDKCLGMLSKSDVEQNLSESNGHTRIKHMNLLEEIKHDELEGHPTMLSAFNARLMGLSAALASSNEGEFGPVSPLVHLDKADGTVEIKAFDGNGFYFRLLISTILCPLMFAQTKVICIRPYTTFTNRLGQALFLKQTVNDQTNVLHPYDWRVSYPLPMSDGAESLQIRLDNTDWSYPLALEKEESIQMSLRADGGRQPIRVEIRGHEEGSRFLVVFRCGSVYGPYRIENRTESIKMKFRQFGLDDISWQQLLPQSTSSFCWEDPHGQQLLEIQAFGMDRCFNGTYDIDKLGDHPPLTCDQQPTICINVQVLHLGDAKVVRFFDKELQRSQSEDANGVLTLIGARLPIQTDEDYITNQLKLVIDVPKLGLSIIDHKPQEILFTCLESVNLAYAMTSEQATSSLKLSIGCLQLDNQSIFSPLPVIIAPERRHQFSKPVLRVNISMADDNDEATKIYPFVGLWVTKSAWQINVHEPLIWDIMELCNNLHFDYLGGSSQVVQVDPEIRIDLTDIAETRLKLTLETAPEQRPHGVLGIWGPLLTSLGNINRMPIQLSGVSDENRYMRQSAVTEAIWNHIRGDLVHQLLQLLFGMDVLGMASSTLGTLSTSAAKLSFDNKFIEMKSKRDRFKQVSGVTRGLLQGSEALASGVVFGVSGILIKPVSNARENGVIGFIQGLGKAAVGFVMQPISGILDFVSLTVDGVSASCTRCYGIFSQDSTPTRIRLPRAIRGDGIIRPYNEREAIGQTIMQLAEVHAVGHRVFKERAKFALSDFYEDHFDVPKLKIVMITSRRVMLLSRPKSLKLEPNKVVSEPSSVIWEVPYSQLLALELTDVQDNQLPSHVILHIRDDPRVFARVIKCYTGMLESGATQAEIIRSAIEVCWKKYGPDRNSLLMQMARLRQYRTMATPRASKRVSVSSISTDEDGKEGGRNASEIANDSGIVTKESTSSSDPRRQGFDSHSFTTEVMLFEQLWTSELDAGVSCCICLKEEYGDGSICSIWRPVIPNGYVSLGDIAYIGKNPPTKATVYKNEKDLFALPSAYDLVWRNWRDGHIEPLTIWRPRSPEGFVSLGCVAVNAYLEPEPQSVWCARSDIVEDTNLMIESPIWQAKSPWHCYIYQVMNDGLTFLATREPKEVADVKPKKVSATC
ncbi:hypothetical protein O6H91_03G054700 [Diphasiastrum complanatum]|nr:hypothetical protein O6H91_03G054700 [Diphasiastrum complanatum]